MGQELKEPRKKRRVNFKKTKKFNKADKPAQYIGRHLVVACVYVHVLLNQFSHVPKLNEITRKCPEPQTAQNLRQTTAMLNIL